MLCIGWLHYQLTVVKGGNPTSCDIITLRLRQNCLHFPDDIFKCIFLNENVLISMKISLKFVPKGSVSNIQALVQIMAWYRPGDKPLSEPMLVSLLTHICATGLIELNSLLVRAKLTCHLPTRHQRNSNCLVCHTHPTKFGIPFVSSALNQFTISLRNISMQNNLI